MARITMFLPGDYRPVPNQLADPNVRTFVEALGSAVSRLGHEVNLIDDIFGLPEGP